MLRECQSEEEWVVLGCCVGVLHLAEGTGIAGREASAPIGKLSGPWGGQTPRGRMDWRTAELEPGPLAGFSCFPSTILPLLSQLLPLLCPRFPCKRPWPQSLLPASHAFSSSSYYLPCLSTMMVAIIYCLFALLQQIFCPFCSFPISATLAEGSGSSL